MIVRVCREVKRCVVVVDAVAAADKGVETRDVGIEAVTELRLDRGTDVVVIIGDEGIGHCGSVGRDIGRAD